jgi:hypothetical protein
VITAGDCTLALHGLRHIVPNCGIRVQNGPDIMAHTGDAGPDAALADLARDAGLLLAAADSGWACLSRADARRADPGSASARSAAS